jgi:excisionase family DNA binding protein
VLDEHAILSRQSDKVGPLQAVAVGPDQTVVLNLGDMTDMRSSSRDEDLLTAIEVATMLRVTPAWVYGATRQGRIPHLRLGRYVRYRRDAILEWLEVNEHGARSPSRL